MTYENDTIECRNCYDRQLGKCPGNPAGKPCRRFAFRDEYCYECGLYKNGVCQVAEEQVPYDALKCEDYTLPADRRADLATEIQRT